MAVSQGKMMITFLLVAGLMQCATAATYTVGDSVGWTFASATFYDDWAKSKTFRVGDELVFVYDYPAHDVFQVSEEDVASCSNTTTIQKWLQSNVTVTLSATGYHGYICSIAGHCSAGGMKMNVQVVAEDSTEPSADSPATAPTAGDTPGNSAFALQSGSALFFGALAASFVALLN